MRYMVFVPGNEQSEAAELPNQELVDRMQRYNDELRYEYGTTRLDRMHRGGAPNLVRRVVAASRAVIVHSAANQVPRIDTIYIMTIKRNASFTSSTRQKPVIG